MNHRIFLLTGPAKSGKTTALRKWAHRRNNVSGIISPNLDGFRCYMDLRSRHYFLMDAVASAAAESVSSEQKQFKSAALERARAILQRAVVPDERDALSQTWVLVDEIGMKEINGGGFEPAVTHLIEEHKMQGNSKLLLVVQSDFLEPVIEHFNIDYFHLVGTGTLKEQL